MAENVGISTGEAMRRAGYSAAMVANPDHLTESKGFAELVEEYLPDWKLAEVHAAGLDAVKITRDKFGDKYEDPDYYVRHSYLESAYRIKGRLNPPNSDQIGDINVTLAIYGKDDKHPNTISVSAQRIPNAVSSGDGRRIQEGSDSLASQEREGQDGTSSSD